MSAQNAFTTVRPRGADTAPAKAPRTGNTSRAPAEGRIHRDSKGRVIDLAPRTKGAITIESREQSAASLAKTQRIKKGAK